jgi:hypothetical protein
MRIPNWVWGVATALALVGPAGAQQLQLPDAVDLRAAYCSRVTAKQLDAQRGLLSLLEAIPASPEKAKLLSDFSAVEDRNRRLRAYLLPRLQFLVTAPIEAAAGMADADAQTNERLLREAGCHESDAWNLLTCSGPVLMGSPAKERQKVCDALNWLPF